MAELLSNTSNNINDISKVTDNKNDSINNRDTRETERRQFYKKRIKKNNIKLEIDENTPQEERRRLLLEYQKKHREKTINTARGILQGYSFESEDEDCTEDMDVEEHSKHYKVFSKVSKIRRMMLSEWMLDVPQDLIENWIMVPCPIGNRVRLISRRGETRAYSRKGILHDVFPSALPGGNPNSDMHNTAAVDCIWIKDRKVFYILDILYWSLLPFTNCEAECRLFWIKNKFQEIPEFRERNTKINKYPILTLQNIDCNSDLSSALMYLDDGLHPLDGFLFYHRKALYTFGRTPLVTWLKPFMLSEVLGIFVPALLDEKPDSYINFEHYMQKINTKKNQETSKTVTNSMEIENIV